MTTSNRRGGRAAAGLLVASALLAGMGPELLGAQVQPVDIEASLRCFVERQGRDFTCPTGVISVAAVVFNPETYGREAVQEVLDGLVDLALSSSDYRTRTSIYGFLNGWGAMKDNGSPRIPGTLERLERLFFEGDPKHRGLAIAIIPAQVDRARAIEFMRRILLETEPPDGHWPLPAATEAVVWLDHLGEEGRNELRALLDADAIVHPTARFSAERRVAKWRPR